MAAHEGPLAIHTPWHALGACNGLDPDAFTISLRGTQGLSESVAQEEANAAAKLVCAGCSVRTECLEEAYATNDRWTIRGGLTPQERRRRRRSTNQPRKASA